MPQLHRPSFFLCLLACWLLSASGWAGASSPQPPEIAARSFLLLDATAGQVLAAREADLEVEPASLTKLMSAYLVFEALRAGRVERTQALTVSERAWRMPGARMFVPQGAQVPVDDLLKGMIVLSANDATIALAEGVAGSVERFVERMNQQARVLGMTRTRFANPEGLSAPGHRSTARDLALLAQRLSLDFPEFMAYFAIQRYRYPGAPAVNENNRNLLLVRDPTVDGMKTGHTEAAGYGMVASAQRPFAALGQGAAGQRRLIAVVLGASSENARAAQSQTLLNWGYSAFEAVRLFAPGQPVATPPVWQGRASTVQLGRAAGVVVALPAGQAAGLRTELLRPEPLLAPLLKDQPLGTLRVRNARGDVVADVPLFVLETVPQAGLLGRFWGALRLWIQ